MLSGVLDHVLALHGWIALAIVFLLPALESSAFVGFVFPGEIAVLLGGVLAYQHRVSLGGAIAAAVLGAVVGDSIGYFIGRRWGRALLRGTVGRIPLVKHHLDKNLDRAQSYVRRRRGSAVFFGRFTAALRVLVPGLAGMSDVHYPTFLLYNVAGALLWGTGFVLLGFGAGASYRRVEHIASWLGLGLLGLIVLILILGRVLRRLRERSDRVRALGDRLAATPPAAFIRRRFPTQLAWLRQRLDPFTPAGFPLTFTIAVGAFAAWWFGILIEDVLSHNDSVLSDPRILSFVIAHRNGALTAFMKVVTWLGSVALLFPLLAIVAGYFWFRAKDWRSGARLAAALLGSVLLYDFVKPAVARPRPPAHMWIGSYSGWSFPSGHATQAIAFYGMVAFLLSASRSPRARALIWTASGLITLVVGASRVYLAAHWLTDVLGGFALGATWTAVIIAVTLWAARGKERTRWRDRSLDGGPPGVEDQSVEPIRRIPRSPEPRDQRPAEQRDSTRSRST
jgi:membrane protein DedA with SNARE-associated domain/membrane-associated phospholipid phosphatase